MNVAKIWKWFISQISSIAENINYLVMVLLIPAMMLLITADVILRFAFNNPLAWSNEILGMMLIMVFFCSLTHCWNVGGHIRLEVLFEHYNLRWKSIINFLTAAIGAFIFGLLTYQSYDDILYALQLPKITLELEWQIWPLNVVIALAALLFTIQLVISCIQALIPNQPKEG